MSRPIRRYHYHFEHPAYGAVHLETEGETPCISKGYAWHDLEQFLKQAAQADLPKQDWRLISQKEIPRI